MASLRKPGPFSADSQTARFLYTILKQLDLKGIDWNEVASGLDITNGHAARMRYSRFRQQMEGSAAQPRVSKSKKQLGKKKEGLEEKVIMPSWDGGGTDGPLKLDRHELYDEEVKMEAGSMIK